jgi:hypothetical protein
LIARAAIAVALALAGAGPASASAPVAGMAGPGPLRQRAYVILPFENITEEAPLDWISGGLALALGETLRGWGARAMDPDERSVFLEANGFPEGSSLTLASVLELGRKMRHRPASLRPDRIVLGRFDVVDGTIRITARTLDLEAEKAGPWIARSGRLRDLLPLQRDVALAIAASEGAAAPGSNDAGRAAGDLPLLAFETYCRAMDETDSRRRLQLLRRAAEEYPDYPEAIYQAAALLARAERWSDAAETLARLKTPPRAYEAGSFILSAILALQQRDHRRAADAARRALALDASARAHLLMARALAGLGDEAGAAAALNHAQDADPADPEIEETRRALGIGPSSPTRRSP